jgi:hypothetical protein
MISEKNYASEYQKAASEFVCRGRFSLTAAVEKYRLRVLLGRW